MHHTEDKNRIKHVQFMLENDHDLVDILNYLDNTDFTTRAFFVDNKGSGFSKKELKAEMTGNFSIQAGMLGCGDWRKIAFRNSVESSGVEINDGTKFIINPNDNKYFYLLNNIYTIYRYSKGYSDKIDPVYSYVYETLWSGDHGTQKAYRLDVFMPNIVKEDAVQIISEFRRHLKEFCRVYMN